MAPYSKSPLSVYAREDSQAFDIFFSPFASLPRSSSMPIVTRSPPSAQCLHLLPLICRADRCRVFLGFADMGPFLNLRATAPVLYVQFISNPKNEF